MRPGFTPALPGRTFTKVQSKVALLVMDYRLKVSITPRVTCGAKRSPVDADVMNDLLKSDLAAF